MRRTSIHRIGNYIMIKLQKHKIHISRNIQVLDNCTPQKAIYNRCKSAYKVEPLEVQQICQKTPNSQQEQQRIYANYPPADACRNAGDTDGCMRMFTTS